MTYIIIGKNEQLQKALTLRIINRENETNILEYEQLYINPDMHFLSTKESSIKIEDAREFIKSIRFQPFQEKYQFGIIENAQALTTEAQNSILKTLEEPSNNTNIILQVSNSKQILETILSRGEKIYLGDTKEYIQEYTLKLTSNDLIGKFKQVEELNKKTKDEIQTELVSMSTFLSTKLSGKKLLDTNIIKHIQEIDNANKHIGSNGNKRLILENLVIQTSNLK